MGLKMLITTMAARDFKAKAIVSTAINGDISPTALDQLQVFGFDSVARKDDTLYYFYTANGQAVLIGETLTDVDRIFLATKDVNDGLPINEGWSRYNGGSGDAIAVLDIGSSGWDGRQVFGRCVKWDEEDNVFKYWYNAQSDVDYKFRLGYATSPDGITWTKHISNPIYSNETVFGNYSLYLQVYKEDSTHYHAIAGGTANVDLVGAIYLTSSDGISWTEQITGILQGSEVRQISKLDKSGSTWILYVEHGVNPDFGGGAGLRTKLGVVTTTDFITFSNIKTIYTCIEPSEAGLGGCNVFELNGKYYWGYHYSKFQLKSPESGREPFTGIRFIESNRPFFNQTPATIEYPSNLKRYYPLWENPESQSPRERINDEFPTVAGTLTWDSEDLKYVDFNGTQLITFPEYIPDNPEKFAVKARIYRELTGSHHIVRQDNPSGNRGWTMYMINGYLRVILFDNTGAIAKSYITMNQVAMPPGVYDDSDHLSIAFTFDGNVGNGGLKLGYGNNYNQPVVKDVDLSLSVIQTGSNDVEIGANGSSIQLRSIQFYESLTNDEFLYRTDL